MTEKEVFNQSQIESEELARIAVEFALKTHGRGVKIIGELSGVVENGIFYTGTVDGVGTKILIAEKLGSYYELGQDVFNSNINDLVRYGVEPKLALPTVSLGSKKEREFEELMSGMAKASQNCGVPIIGGETEVLRNVFASSDTINVAVATFGWQEVSKLITGEAIIAGDGIFALPSTGLHTNGFSEIVKKFTEIDLTEVLYDLSCGQDGTVEDWLKKPTANYLDDFLLLDAHGIRIKAAENVTGGGFRARLLRLLEDTLLEAEIIPESWPKPAIFDYLQQKFGWTAELMFRTFNMGAGMFLVIAQNDCEKTCQIIKANGRRIFKIGQVRDLNSGKL